MSKKDLIAIYVRVSTQEQAINGHSIDEQIDRLNKYCEAMGWTVYKVYTDAGFSGGNTDRPALQKMIRDIKDGKVTKVLVYKLDRLSRSQLDTIFLIQKVFMENDTDFVSMSENFDTATPFGRAIIGILAVFAELEREQIKERMAMGKEARAKQGKYGGGSTVQIGYDYIDGELITNEYEKMQVLKIFDMFLKGVSIREIEKTMFESGYSHKHGTWNRKTIREVLRSNTYLGYIKFRGTWYRGNHEAIIDVDTHDKVVRMLDERAEAFAKSGRRGKVTSYLGGLLRCKKCGATMAKRKQGKKQNPYYICYSRTKRHISMIKDPNCKNKSWRMEELDNLVFDEIRKLATDPEYIGQIRYEKPDENNAQLLQSEIEKIDSQMSKLMDLYALGNMPIEMIEKRIHDLNDQKQKLEDELDAITDEERSLSNEEILEAVSSFSDVLERGNFEEIRLIIETLIDYIEIDDENVDIHWKFA